MYAKRLCLFRNNVWGVGPKIGGNSAGLLNFGRKLCPYDLVTPWEFGTRRKSKQRQVDYQLEVTCQKSIESLNISLNQKLPIQLKTIFTSTPPTTLSSSTSTTNANTSQHQDSTLAPSVIKPVPLPKCGGVRRSAALDNIFGKLAKII